MKSSIVVLLIQFTSFLVFIGRAYQFFFFETPFHPFLSDESLIIPLCALLLLLAALTSIFWFNISIKKLRKWFMAIGISVLVLIGLYLVKEKNYDILQFLELTIQLASPLSLFFLSKNNHQNAFKQIFFLKFAIALTFIAHGLFALGIPYLPGHFIEMTVTILPITEEQARQLLFTAGVFDIMASLLLFVPKTGQYALIYMVIWGCLTALARVASGIDSQFFIESLHNSAYLTIYRLPHGLLPLAVFVLGVQRAQVNAAGSRL
ncbi:MAG: hypothetical protein AAGF85_19755 [Bacteroidota bacterium]